MTLSNGLHFDYYSGNPQFNSVAGTLNKSRALLPGCFGMQGVIYRTKNKIVKTISNFRMSETPGTTLCVWGHARFGPVEHPIAASLLLWGLKIIR
jgi:hypothetical protein